MRSAIRLARENVSERSVNTVLCARKPAHETARVKNVSRPSNDKQVGVICAAFSTRLEVSSERTLYAIRWSDISLRPFLV